MTHMGYVRALSGASCAVDEIAFLKRPDAWLTSVAARAADLARPASYSLRKSPRDCQMTRPRHMAGVKPPVGPTWAPKLLRHANLTSGVFLRKHQDPVPRYPAGA